MYAVSNNTKFKTKNFKMYQEADNLRSWKNLIFRITFL